MNLILVPIGGYRTPFYETEGDVFWVDGLRFDLGRIGSGDWLDMMAFATGSPRRLPGWIADDVRRNAEGVLEVRVMHDPTILPTPVPRQGVDGPINWDHWHRHDAIMAEAKANVARGVLNWVDQQIDLRAGVYSRTEKDSWPRQDVEATKFLDEGMAEARAELIQALARRRGVSAGMVARSIQRKSRQFARLAELAVITREFMEARFQAAVSPAEVRAIKAEAMQFFAAEAAKLE